MITLEPILIFAGLLFMAFAIATALDKTHPKRRANSVFYVLLGVSFLFGSKLPDLANGILALGLVMVGGVWGTGRGPANTTSESEREALASRYKSAVFIPALLVPFCALLGSTVLKGLKINGTPLVDPNAAILVWVYTGILLGLVVAMLSFRPPLSSPVTEGRRLMDTVGWALLLPQMLASLGAVFAISGVGTAVGSVFATYLPITSPQAAVIIFGLGMAAFGLPLVVRKFGGNVIALSAVGMLTGFCGTLLTPMAANFNLVPSALLELKDRYGVIRAQAPTALLLLIGNIVLLCLVVYR